MIFLIHEAETSQAQVDSTVVVVAGWEMDLDHLESTKRRWRVTAAFILNLGTSSFYEGCVLQLGKGKLDDEVSGSVLHVVLHPRCCGLWARRNTAQAFEDLKENVHSFVYMQTSGAEYGRCVTEDEIFHFSTKTTHSVVLVVNRAIRQKK